MYHLLVVDDEARHRRGLIQAIRRTRSDFIIEEAINGEEALMIFEHRAADMILTDIRMPVMDGLAFMERLRDLAGDTLEIIIVTAYRDFSYAQQAIKLHASEYILKPVEPDMLADVIQRSVERLEARQLRTREQIELRTKWEIAQPVYLERQLGKYLAGGLPPEEWAKVQAVGRLLGRSGAAAAIRFGGGAPPDERRGDIEAYLRLLQQYIGGESYAFLLDGSAAEAALITTFPEGSKDGCENFPKQLRQALEKSNRQGGFEFMMTAGVSRCCQDIGKECQSSYQQALMACDNRFYDRETVVFLYSPNQINRASEHQSADTDTDHFAALIAAAMDEAKVTFTMDFFKPFTGVLQQAKLPSKDARHLLSEVIHLLLNRLETLPDMEMVRTLIRELEHDAIPSLLRSEFFEEAVRIAEQAMRRIMQLLTGRGANKMERAIASCTAYIDERFREDLTLEEMAERFGFNAFYFSHVFKQTTGYGFSEYVQNRRLLEAKRLLESSDDKVYLIAGRAGYRDVKYFNRMFKRKTGMTPEQYRSLYRTSR